MAISTWIQLPIQAFAAEAAHGSNLDLTTHGIGYASPAIFVVAYLLIMGEEFINLRK
ncbi:MAG: hypothetical protein Q7U88_11840 [Desulfocapsaceae bacterium]|nr:hypothetical protein [Desulfocapsaceae bacterium]